MALRNQPYFPLYVQDYLTDEKLNMCSWKTQGIYIKIMCCLHKQEDYGALVLFKQTDKQILDFASILIKLIPCSLDEMIEALEELVFYKVLTLKGSKLLQKRMVRDNEISIKRSKAGKSGGGNPNLFRPLFKQTDKQNTEYEYEDGIEDVNDNEINSKVDFEVFWNAYDKKVGSKVKLKKKWDKLSEQNQLKILKHIELYKAGQPDKQYRKNPETYLNNESWNDEIIRKDNGNNKGYIAEDILREASRIIFDDPDLKK